MGVVRILRRVQETGDLSIKSMLPCRHMDFKGTQVIVYSFANQPYHNISISMVSITAACNVVMSAGI